MRGDVLARVGDRGSARLAVRDYLLVKGRSEHIVVGGSYPPNLMVSEAALAAAVDQGAPDHGWPVFKYQPKAPTHERPKVGGGYSM